MSSSFRIRAAASAVAFALMIAGPGALAASAAGSPTPGSATPAGATGGHPVHLHSGTCAKLGAVVYPLADLTAPSKSATPTAAKAGTPTAAEAGTPTAGAAVVASSTTKVKVALKDLEKTPFAINAHESTDNIADYIACGDVKGDAKGGKLTITLSELSKSGLEGDATLTDNGDGTTTVVVELSKKKG